MGLSIGSERDRRSSRQPRTRPYFERLGQTEREQTFTLDRIDDRNGETVVVGELVIYDDRGESYDDGHNNRIEVLGTGVHVQFRQPPRPGRDRSPTAVFHVDDLSDLIEALRLAEGRMDDVQVSTTPTAPRESSASSALATLRRRRAS
jgi:hypothetical protein